MSKEIEALELIDSYIKLDEYDRETSGVADAIRLLRKTLTEPSAEYIIAITGKFLSKIGDTNE